MNPTRPSIARLDPAAYRRIQWKNGGGMTVDIAGAVRPGHEPDSWTGMVWRFGRTRIETPAPFSDLSGYDRILVVVDGRGLVLRVSDGRVIDAREPLRPVRFRGDWSIRSELEGGSVGVLNLMGDRAAVTMDMRILKGPGEFDLAPGTTVVHAPLGPAEVSLGEGPLHRLASDEALTCTVDAPTRITGRGGYLVVATVKQIGPDRLPIGPDGGG